MAVTIYWSHSKAEQQNLNTQIPFGGVLTGCFYANGVLELALVVT